MIKGWSRRRRLVAAALVLVLAAAVVVGFRFAPAVDTGELPESITIGGIAYERVDLVTFRTYPGSKRVALVAPETVGSIVVRAACRFAVFHTGDAQSALGIETWWTLTGGNDADLPDTDGNEYLLCTATRQDPRWLTRTIDPDWLPRKDGRRQLIWHEWPTLADAPSDARASWALAVYTAR